MPAVDRAKSAKLVGATLLGTERHRNCKECHTSGTGGNAMTDPKDPNSSVEIKIIHDKINLHYMKGSHSIEQLTGAIKAQLTAVREDDKLKVTIVVTNLAAGHYIPTGSPLRQLILEVSGDTGDGKHFTEERVYGRTVADQLGKLVEREYNVFVKGAKTIADTRLAPDEKRTETFLFDVPQGI